MNARAFSLLELVVATVILLLVLSFLATALGRAVRSARKTASQRSVESIAAAVEQFRVEFGFLPPLVHDGFVVSVGVPDYIPTQPDGSPYPDGPIESHNNGVYDFSTLVTWSEGYDFDFFRRRDGSDPSDPVLLPSGNNWNIDSAWDDRRYSRYALAYYLAGALPRSVDGVAGLGMARPMGGGLFQGVGYPIGTTRDRYEPTIDLDRRGINLQTGYVRVIEFAEHDPGLVYEDMEISDAYDLYPPEHQDLLVSLVDNFGTAYRYYRWEHGRYDDRSRIVIENSLDLNIPPVLLDPEALVLLENDDAAVNIPDLTAGNLKLREARFAIVGAGADRLFGTEPIAYIVEQLHERDPDGDPAAIARLRKLAMDDNIVAYGK